MTTRELETKALKLAPHARARLAGKLLESLESLTQEENEALWAEEAERRLKTWDRTRNPGIPAKDAFRAARSKLR